MVEKIFNWFGESNCLNWLVEDIKAVDSACIEAPDVV
jgi:hypothetical protein